MHRLYYMTDTNAIKLVVAGCFKNVNYKLRGVSGVYKAAIGSTVIFSCNVKNMDGDRGRDWDVLYKLRGITGPVTHNQTTDGLLYIKNVTQDMVVRCDTAPQPHISPLFADGLVRIVDSPPIQVQIQPQKTVIQALWFSECFSEEFSPCYMGQFKVSEQ
eukprot:sb/3472954/